MPRSLPVPVRQAIWRRYQDGQDGSTIAKALGLAARTVRKLIRRFRLGGQASVTPSYDRCGVGTPKLSEPIVQAAVGLRREHPSWGAGLIRVLLRRQRPGDPPPAERTLQRWFRRAGLSAAPPGRRPAANPCRAERPHEVWQMDAAEQVTLKTGQRVSWLRLVDECSGAVLLTVVFPPREMEPSTARGGPGSLAACFPPLGATRAVPGGQRRAVGLGRRPAHRPGLVADRPGDGNDLEHAAKTAGKRRGGAVAGDGQAMVRTPGLRHGGGVAESARRDGRHPASGVSKRARTEPLRGISASGPFGTGVYVVLGTYPLETGCGRGASGRVRGTAASGQVGDGVVVQSESLCG
jgi:transposase